MSAQEEKKAFEQMLAATQAKSWRPSWICEVKDVDRDAKTCTCTPTNGDAEKTASLRAAETDDTDYVVQYPKVGSLVLVELTERIEDNCVVAMVTVVDEISWKIGDTTQTVKDGLIEWNGGNNKGLLLLIPVLNAFNALQNDVNELKSFIAGWTPSPNDGGAALKVALSSWFASRLTVTRQQDIENTKIKQ